MHCFGRRGVARPHLHLSQLGDSEVENLHAAVSGDEDVGGLDVAVHDAVRMSGSETTPDLAGVVDRLLPDQGAPLDLVREGLPVEQLGDDVGRTIVAADVVDRQDVGMDEAGDGERFLFEAMEAIRIAGKRRQ